jgi:hypothetical protein
MSEFTYIFELFRHIGRHITTVYGSDGYTEGLTNGGLVLPLIHDQRRETEMPLVPGIEKEHPTSQIPPITNIKSRIEWSPAFERFATEIKLNSHQGHIFKN